MTDIHTHILRAWGEKPLTAKKLLRRMDELGMEKFVILPTIGPEGPYFYSGPEEVLSFYRRHSEKVIPFCNIDPRAGDNSPETDFSFLLNKYKKDGCKGVGEITANIYMDSPLCINLFKQCGKTGLPVLFHLYNKTGGSYGLVDDIHLPRLEKVLKECPDTIFIGHAMAFWAEISGDVAEETRGGYPSGPVKSSGRLTELLKKYPNLYGDLSAGSGYNAITRFNWDVEAWKPTVISVELGMNDCVAGPDSTPLYIANMNNLVGRINKTGARPVLFTSSPHNDGSTTQLPQRIDNPAFNGGFEPVGTDSQEYENREL